MTTKFYQGPYGLLYEDEETLLAKERELNRLQVMNRLLVGMHSGKAQSRNAVHQEMTSQGGYTTSSLAETMTEQEQQVIMEKFNELKQLRAEYIASYNQRAQARKNTQKLLAKLAVDVLAFNTGLLTQLIPKFGLGPAAVMGIATTIWNQFEYLWDMDDIRPALDTHRLLGQGGISGFSDAMDSWDFLGWLENEMTRDVFIDFNPGASLAAPPTSASNLEAMDSTPSPSGAGDREQPDILRWAASIGLSSSK